MLEKLTKKLKKTTSKKNTSANIFITICLISIAIFITILFLTYNLLLALISGICVFFLLYYLFDGLSLNTSKLQYHNYEKDKVYFYDLFMLYSSLENDYLIGFKKAVDNLNISELKDSLQNYIESDLSGKLPIQLENSLIDNEIVDLINIAIHDRKETNITTLERLKNNIIKKKDEIEQLQFTAFPIINVFLAIYLLAFTLSFAIK